MITELVKFDFIHSIKKGIFLFLFLYSLGNSVYSQSCPSITIVRQPTSFDAWTGYSGTANNFSVYATSTGGALSYQWERSTDNGATWAPITANLDAAATTYSSFNAATLYYTNTSGSITALDGFKYRVKVSNSTCFTYSNVVTLRVFGPTFYSGLFLPATTNYCSSSPTLSVELNSSTNSSLTAFSWERRVGSSGSWVTITSSNATTLDAGMAYTNFNTGNLQVDGVTSASQTLQYRCRVTISVVSRNVIQTSSGSTTNSNSNTISGVYTPITSLAPGTAVTITQQPPTLVSYCSTGGIQTISTTASTSNGNLIYQWQISTNGSFWANIEDDAVFTGAQTSSLIINDPPSALSNNQLRCRVTSDVSNCNTYTTVSTIKRGSPPTFSTQPPYPNSGSGTYCQNSASYNAAIFLPVISGMSASNSSGFSFQWFRNTSNSYTGATEIEGQTNPGGYPPTDQAGTFYLFLRVTNAEGCSTNSAIVGPYTITPAPTITQQPSLPSTSICAGEPFSMSVSATPPTGGTLSYQWQRNGANITGATSPTYSVASATTGMAGRYTVRITSSPTNCVTTSAPIDLSVTAAPSLPTAVTASPAIICTDPNSTSNLSATTSASNVIYWYESASGGTPIGFTTSGQALNVKPSATKTFYAETRAIKQLSFAFSREVQTWVVPQGISSLEVDIKGGGGGSGGTDSGSPGGGGGGARATGTIAVTPGMKFRFAIGSEGTQGGGCRNPISVFGGFGGFNALGYHGGRGGDSGFSGCSGGGGGGGAATVVQLLDANDNVLNTWVLAGGGGGGGAGQFGNGGSGMAFANTQTINSILGARGGIMVGDGAGGGAGGGGIKGGIGAGPGGEGGAPGGYQGQSQIGNLTSQTAAVGDGWFKVTIAGSADFSCPSLTRVPVTVTVSQNASVIITSQPQPVLQCGSATSTFSVTATDATSYQWQVSSNSGTSWTNITGASVPAFTGKTFAGFNSASLSVTATATSANSYLYRCIVSNDCSSVTSNSALHEINAINSYTLANKVLCASPTSTTITSTVVGNAATLIQWERSTNNGSTWQVITPSLDAGTTYSGFNTGTLTINPVPNHLNGYLYRIVASNSSCTNISNTASLTVTPTPIISTQPVTVNNCNSGTAQFTVAASNTVTAYQWSVSTNGGATWTNITGATAPSHTGINYSGWNTANLGLSASPASANNYQYRCTLTNTCGTTVSNVARLNPTPYAGIISGPSILCVGNPTALSLIDVQLNGRIGTWTSSNTSVATVNSTTGVVTPIGAGTATITYTLSSSSCSGTFSTTKSITVQTCTDSDNDGVGDLIDIDDDNDGVLDSDEKCQLPNLITLDGSFENLYSVASSDAFNSNVTSAGWTNGSGSADSWISPMLTTGSAVWGGMADGTPPSPNGGVFAGGWVTSTTPNTTGESFYTTVTGLTVGQRYTLRFFQANAGIEGNTPLGDRANWRVVFGTEAKLTTERSYLGEGNQTWNEEALEFTATATSQRLEFFVNNGNDATLNGSTYDVMAIDGITLVRGSISDECILDTDNDGTPNHRDLDSDGDGCSDALESGATNSTTANYQFTGTFGANGYINTLETAPESGVQNYLSSYAFNALSRNISTCADSDADGISDLLDLDDDNDGVIDALESPSCFYSASEFLSGNRSSTGIIISSDLQMSASYNTPSKLVDGDEAIGTAQYATQFIANNTIDEKTVYKFEFPISIEIEKIVLRFVNTNSPFNAGSVLKLQGSNNNTTWTDLNIASIFDATTNNSIESPFSTVAIPNEVFSVTQNGGKYKFYRIYALSGGINANGIANEVYFQIPSNYVASYNPKSLCSADTDNDSIPNHRDLDSDGDGCSDARESGATTSSTSNFQFTGAVGANGLDNSLETNDTGTINYTSTYSPYALSANLSICADTDSDGVGDLVDLDDDNDGVLDHIESASCFSTAVEAAVIASVSTGLQIYSTNAIGNAIDNNASTYSAFNPSISWVGAELFRMTPNVVGGLQISGVQLDLINWAISSSTANTFKLQGSNNNGTTWVDLSAAVSSTAASGSFTISNTLQPSQSYTLYRIVGVAGTTYYGGVTEMRFLLPSTYNPSAYPKASCAANADGDALFNHLDLDSDGDGCSDALEGGATTTTTANFQFTGTFGANGYINTLETASESGIPNYSSTYVPYALSRNIDLCSDFDNDGVRDFTDIDDDNDGVLDAVESPSCFYQANEFTNGNRAATAIGITSEIPMNAPYNVFNKLLDGDETTGSSQYAVQFVNGTSIVNKEVYKFEFPVPIELTRINLRFVNTNSHFNSGTTIKLQGSNDNSIWTDLNAGASYDASTDNNIIAPYWTVNTPNEQFSVTQNQGRYRYYRLFATAGVVNSNGLPNEVYFTLPATYNASLNPKANCGSDADNDGNFNHRDLDSDGDGCSDALEGGATTTTTANYQFTGTFGANGYINTLETASESGIPNYSSTYVPYALSRNIDLCSDFDRDGVRDFTDIDDDNDGVLDAVESPSCFYQSNEFTNGNRASTGIGITTEIPMNATYNVPSKLVDGDETTGGSQYAVQFVNGTSIVNREVYKFEFPVPIELTRINLRFVNTNSHFNSGTTIKLQGSNDNSIWTDLNTGASYDASTDNNIIAPYWTANTPNEQFSVTQNQGSYRYYRLFATAGVVNSNGLPNEVYFTLPATYQASSNPKTSCSSDTDGDQIVNHRDLDSDGDGCSDAKEANATTSAVVNFAFSGSVGVNGLVDSKETSTDSGVINYVSYYDNALNNTRNGCTDTDNDGIGDLIDIDDDNDGVLDTTETSSCATIGRDITTLTFNGQAITSVTSTSIATANTQPQGLGWRSSYSSQTLPLPISLTFKASSSVARDVMIGLMPANNTQNPTSWSDGGYKFYFTGGTVWVSYGGTGQASQAQVADEEYKLTISATGQVTFFINNVQKATFAGVNSDYRLVVTSYTAPFTFSSISLTDLVNVGIFTCTDLDTDNDGTPNRLDLDSDGDGCSDARESGATTSSTANYQFTGAVGANGLDNSLETNDTGTINYTSTYSPYALSANLSICADTDSDGVGDLVDLDDDNDGVLDHIESASCFSTAVEAAVIASVSTGLQIYSTNAIGNAIDNNAS